MNEGRSPAFYALAAFFGLFVLFLYGPMIVIFILSFQGPTGGLTFPMNGVSLHWFERLWEGGGIVDIAGAFQRSLALGLVVMVLTVVLSLLRGPRVPQALLRLEPAVLRHRRQPDRALDRHLARHRAGIPHARRSPQEPRAGLDRRRSDDDDGHVHLRARRASDLDAAVRPAGDVRDLQPLRRALRGGGARSRRDAVADACATSCCRSSCPR